MTETQPEPRIGWTILRRVLLCAAIVATLVAAFYAEEDWRGQRAWTNCKRRLEAEGVVLDWKAFVPPPVPDDQNVFAAPHMMEWFSVSNLVAINTTSPALRMGLTNTYATIADERTASNYLVASDQFEPVFFQVRAALQRPAARMFGDYSRPYQTPVANYVTVREFCLVLAQRAKCYALRREPEKALSELTLLNNSRRLIEGAPPGKSMLLVAAMLDTAVAGIYAQTIADILRTEALREPQLAALRRQLSGIDLPMLLAAALQSERAASCAFQATTTPKEHGFAAPRGWTCQKIAAEASVIQEALARLDLKNQLILPCDADEIYQGATTLRLPYDSVAKTVSLNCAHAIKTVARVQTALNQAQIACALEGYRLARGQYPDKLDALVPEFIEKLPHDLIGGQPLHYRREPNGNFLLYSIGWNNKDDGGQPSPSGQSGQGNGGERDWVWLGTPKALKLGGT